MAYVLALYVNDDVFGPSLELMRRICEPYSQSRPHITVRGPIRKKRLETELLYKRFKQVNLIEVGDFIARGGGKQNTVFLLCDVFDFADIYDKSDFYASPPHITIYDGSSRPFAVQLLKEISSLDWNFNILLKKEYDKEKKIYDFPRLSQIYIGRKKKRSLKILYSKKAAKLFGFICGQELTQEYLEFMSDEKRIDFVKKVHGYLLESIGKKQQSLLIAYNYNNEELSGEKKNVYGQVSTPPELANEIVSYIHNTCGFLPESIRYGDPSVGTGSFFYALKAVFKENLIESSIGIEIDPFTAFNTEKKWGQRGLNVVHKNFFDYDLSQKRDLIISNPPYVRHHKISKKDKFELRDRVKSLLGLKASGLTSLYVYFLLLSHEWLKEGGLGVWLIPSEFMETNYGAVLRSYLTNYVRLLSIHRYSPKDLKFEGVTVTSCLVVYQKIMPVENDIVKVTRGGSLLSPEEITKISIDDLRQSDKWPLNISSIYNKVGDSLLIGDLFDVKRGIATGANSLFILKLADYNRYDIPERCIKPILPNPRFLKENVIENDDRGWPIIKNIYILIDCDIPEDQLNKECPELYNYFEKNNADNLKERYLIKSRSLWYKQEKRIPPRFLCTYFGRKKSGKRSFRFIFNKSDAVATNAYLLMYPKEPLVKLLEKDNSYYEKIYGCLQEINEGSLIDNGRIYGGGLYKLEPKELIAVNADTFKKIL